MHKVLLIGDACLDVYIFVHNHRKNPETDAPLLTEMDRIVTGGMGRNVKRCLEALGIEVVAKLATAMSEKVRIVDNDSGQNYFRVDHDVRAEPADLSDINFYEFDAVVISDYNKGYIREETILEVQDKFSGPIFLDTKKTNIAKFDRCLIKINEDEYLKITSEIPVDTVVTTGSTGAFIIDEFGTTKVPGVPAKAVDTCGAGDVFLSGYVFGYLEESPSTWYELKYAVEYGNILAAKSVEVYGIPAQGPEVIKNYLNKI